jgi:hypothetical protein
MSPTMALVANIGMFIVTAIVCFVLVRGFKSFAFAGVSETEFVLTTSRQIEAGEPLSLENAQWKRVGSTPPPGLVVSKSAATPLAGYVATSRIGAGKPIRAALVAKLEGASEAPKVNTTAGYVLSGDDAANVLPYVKPGSQIDVVAIVSGDSDGKGDLDRSARVATVITNAPVTGVMRAPPTHGPGARSGSLVIGVSDEQARLLGVLSHFATLDFVLSPKRVGNGDQAMTAWRSVAELGVPLNGEERSAASLPPPIKEARIEKAPPIEALPEEKVTVITPGGVAQAAVKN